MLRSALVAALLTATAAAAQPVTYFQPITARTTAPLSGSGPVDVTLWLSDPGVDVAQSLLFATVPAGTTPFTLGTLDAGTVASLPTGVVAVAAAPGVLVQGRFRTLLAVASGGRVTVGTLENGAFVDRGPNLPVSGGPPIALAASPDGGAALLVSDSTATQLTRWDLGLTSSTAFAVQGLTAAPLTEPARSLLLDGADDIVLAGGQTLGNLYLLPAALDGGATLWDAALTSQGRLAAPVTGLALYRGTVAGYLLVSNGQGLTVYDLTKPDPRPGAIRMIAQDGLGQLSVPTGVAVTNLPAGRVFPSGDIALGDPSNQDLALVRWDLFARDAGLIIDTTADPRGPAADGGADAGCPDGGTADGGSCGAPPAGGPTGPGVPPGPGVPVDHGTSCASAGGAPALAGLLALLLLLPRRRQRR